jgi:hypothetical protein
MTHWKAFCSPDKLGAWDFETPESEMTLTIKDVKPEEVIDPSKKKRFKPIIYWHENVKPMVCNSTNARTIAKIFGSHRHENWIDKKITLYVDPKVNSPQGVVEGIRVKYVTQQSKPTLNESHPRWSEAIKAVQGGKDAATFRTHFEVSDADVIKLNQYKPKQ